MRLIFCLIAGAALAAAAQPIDLTYPFDEKTIYWPTSKSFEWKLIQRGKTPGGYFYLEQVPATGATLIALPMKIRGGTGAPVRIVATLPN